MLGYGNVGLDKFFVWNYNNYLEKNVDIWYNMKKIVRRKYNVFKRIGVE